MTAPPLPPGVQGYAVRPAGRPWHDWPEPEHDPYAYEPLPRGVEGIGYNRPRWKVTGEVRVARHGAIGEWGPTPHRAQPVAHPVRRSDQSAGRVA
jgi:hypothetical protein